jgi:hypothetical protein
LDKNLEQVKSFIDTAIQPMERDKINKHNVARLIGKVTGDLASGFN